MTIDATERAELEQLRLAVRLYGANVWSWDLIDGDLAKATATFVNLEASRGYDPDEVPKTFGGLLSLVVVPDDQARFLGDAQAHVDGKTEHFECEYRVRHKDGSLHWNLARGVAIRDAVGRPV